MAVERITSVEGGGQGHWGAGSRGSLREHQYPLRTKLPVLALITFWHSGISSWASLHSTQTTLHPCFPLKSHPSTQLPQTHNCPLFSCSTAGGVTVQLFTELWKGSVRRMALAVWLWLGFGRDYALLSLTTTVPLGL